MKNKNGFTLIELLVVIVLVISLLSISIISSVKISERKKLEAYKEVVKEIEVAAQQYFSSKEYLFEGIEGDSFGKITLQKLVSEDYLNKVTDPRTGKSINLCNYVEIKRTSDGIIKSSYKEENSNVKTCPDLNKSIIYQYGGPKLELDIKGTYGNNGWFISKPTSTLIVDNQGSGEIISVKKRVNNENRSVNLERINQQKQKEVTIINDTKKDYIMYEVTNEYGKIARTEITLKVDTKAPKVEINMENSNWTNKEVKYTFSASDELSLSSIQTYWNMYGLSQKKAEKDEYRWNNNTKKYNNSSVKENWGGTWSKSLSINTDNSNEIVFKGSGSFKNVYENAGYRKIRAKACDDAGNCSYSREGIAKIDISAPNITSYVSNSNWTNQVITYGYKNLKDDLSGVDSVALYANAISLTDDLANSQNFNWNGSSYNNGSVNGASLVIDNSYTTNLQNQGSRRIKFKVCDKAGNCRYSDEIIAKYEKTITMDIEDKTKYSRNNKGNLAFNGTYGLQYFTEITSNPDPSHFDPTASGNDCNGVNKCYYAKICRYIGGFDIWFNIDSLSTGKSEITDDATNKSRWCGACPKKACSSCRYYRYDYTYTSPAGNKATVRTFEDYSTSCGY